MRKLTAGAQKSPIVLIIAAITGLSLALGSLSAAADIYRWIDERGVVNYTQQKPNNVPSTLVGKATTPVRRSAANATAEVQSNRSSRNEERQAQLTPAQQERLDELKAREQEQAELLASRQQDSCNRAQTVLEQLTANNRIKIRGDDGSVRAIGEDERQARIQETQLSIAEYCES